MAKSLVKTFKATLVPDGTNLKWTIASIPLSVTDGWKSGGRPRVRGEINGFPFRTTLFPTGKGDFTLLVNKKMQAGAKAAPGSVVSISLQPDEDERVIVTPPELKEAFSGSAPLRRWYDRLPYSFRKYVTDDITNPKDPEARVRRAERMAELLFSMMEGEKQTPPILEAAFVRQPLARVGWEAMTPIQRRGHLWGIFYYQAPESRRKRAQKAIDEALRIAKGKAAKPVPENGSAAKKRS